MKTAALFANGGLLVALIAYVVTLRGIELEVRELPVFGFMLVAPILSILSLVQRRADPTSQAAGQRSVRD